jgi:hypothetical protein
MSRGRRIGVGAGGIVCFIGGTAIAISGDPAGAAVAAFGVALLAVVRGLSLAGSGPGKSRREGEVVVYPIATATKRSLAIGSGAFSVAGGLMALFTSSLAGLACFAVFGLMAILNLRSLGGQSAVRVGPEGIESRGVQNWFAPWAAIAGWHVDTIYGNRMLALTLRDSGMVRAGRAMRVSMAANRRLRGYDLGLPLELLDRSLEGEVAARLPARQAGRETAPIRA